MKTVGETMTTAGGAVGGAVTSAGKGAATATSHAMKTVAFNFIKYLVGRAYALIKEPAKIFLSIILLAVLIRLSLPYFISFFSYLIAKFLLWFFSPFYHIPDNISHAIQDLGDALATARGAVGDVVAAAGKATSDAAGHVM
ncbi:MAG: hypothetical protein TE42_09740, partial [Candidatus Synechococcus spongiarum SP3]